MIKESYGKGEPKNIILAWVQTTHKPVRIVKAPAVPHMGNNANLRDFGATYRHGIVFAPK